MATDPGSLFGSGGSSGFGAAGTTGGASSGGATTGGSSSRANGGNGGSGNAGSGGSGNGGNGGGPTDAGLPDVGFEYDAPVIVEDACAGETVTAEPVPVSIYIMLDTSGSMRNGRLTDAKAAINAFVQDPGSAGLGVALDHFPSNGGFTNNCVTSAYTNPDVGMGTLPGNQAAITSAVNSYSASGGTPTLGALNGVTNFCNNYQIATGIKCVGIVISDGFPESNDCSTNHGADLNAVAANALSQWDVNTFTMGLSGLNAAGWAILHGIAQAGGSDCDGNSGNANYACDASGGTQAFIDALNAIRNQVLSCDFAVPQPSGGVPDWDQVGVTFTPGGGSASDIGRVNDAAACSGAGWYYDNNATPTTITLCPNSCTTIQGDPNGEVNIELPCLGS